MGEAYDSDPVLDDVRGNRLGDRLTDVRIDLGQEVTRRLGERSRRQQHVARR
jgi:hypothetical protein